LHDAPKYAKISQLFLPGEVGYLIPKGGTQTHHIRQKDLKKKIPVATANCIFDLKLPSLGPYKIDFTRNGRHVLLGGRKGHFAMVDLMKTEVVTEIQVQETIRDVKVLHNETFLAAAQRKYVYIYDDHGVEIHRLKNHEEVCRLEFLPYHYLLVSVGILGKIVYTDITTGQTIVTISTRSGLCDCLRQNPYNAVITTGHSNGVVTMWVPTMQTPVLSMLAHHGRVQSLAFTQSGHQMVTAGADQRLKIWDLRMNKPVFTHVSEGIISNVDISQTGLIAASRNDFVEVWKDSFTKPMELPYMRHKVRDCQIESLRFRPYQDVLGIGHSSGFSSIVIPGCGEPNFDSFEANPFETSKQRRETEVHGLLDKLPPDMISLDPNFIGEVEPKMVASQVLDDNLTEAQKELKEKSRARRLRKKMKTNKNVIDADREKVRQEMLEKKEKKKREIQRKEKENLLQRTPNSLKRFVK